MKFPSQPAFDDEFTIFLAGVAVLIALMMYGISDWKARRAHKKLLKEIDAFNKMNPNQKGVKEAMYHYRVRCKSKKISADDVDAFDHSECYKNHLSVDVFMRPVKDGLFDVYSRAPLNKLTGAQELSMEIWILDENGVAIIDSKFFKFLYIKGSWAESMMVFFMLYQKHLMYYRLCDAWDMKYFGMEPALTFHSNHILEERKFRYDIISTVSDILD